MLLVCIPEQKKNIQMSVSEQDQEEEVQRKKKSANKQLSSELAPPGEATRELLLMFLYIS